MVTMTQIKPLRYWVQKVLPLVYDDSLSYYELLSKVVTKINELIEANNGLSEAIEAEIADQLTTAVPDEVYTQLFKMLNEGVLNELIIESAKIESQKYLGEIFDTGTIDYLETVNGDPIFTVGGEYIFIQNAIVPTAYTTNDKAYFYKYLHDASNKIVEGKKPYNPSSWAYLTQTPVLTLAHYSDYHGDDEELDYIYNNWGSIISMCDDVLCTGDMVWTRFTDAFNYFANSDKLSVKKTLLTIGNHDALTDPSGYDWTQLASQQELYNKYFAPTIANWGAVYTTGLTYYYKDYDSNNIRLIVLNDMLTGSDMQAQLIWLRDTALNTNKKVVIAKHYMPSNPVKIDCTFSSYDTMSSGYDDGSIANIVQTFINNGGTFICYLVGHDHRDFVCYLGDYPSQIAIGIDATSREQCNQYSDVMRDDSEISRDLFNVVQFDTSSNAIKIIRCGCNYDRYLRHKDVLTINYLTKAIIYN